MNNFFKFIVEIEECDGEYRSVISANNGVDEWELWRSHYSGNAADALKKATKLMADMPVDFIAAFNNRNPMNKKHPKVNGAK